MSVFFSLIFCDIFGILFEPIAVCALLGMIWAAVMYWKSKTPLYWFFGISLLFMLGWRLGIQIVSSRYASILIYPAIMASAYFCFQTELLVKYIPRFPKKWHKLIPYCCVIALCVASICQSLHYNPYADYMIRIGSLIRNDVKKTNLYAPYVMTIETETRRLSYYSGYPVEGVADFYSPVEKYAKHIGRRLCHGTANPTDSIYFILYKKTKIDIERYLQYVPEKFKDRLQDLGTFYQNRKKKNQLHVFRCDIRDFFEHSVVPVLKNQQAAKKADYRFTFDKIYPPGHQYYRNIAAVFAKQPQLQAPKYKNLPMGWSLTGKYGSSAECNVVKDQEGKNIFHLKSASLITCCAESQYPAKKWRLTMKLSGKKDTLYSLALHCYDGKRVWNGHLQLPVKKIVDENKLYEYSCIVEDGYYPLDTKFIRPMISLTQGELFVHSVELYSMEK